MIKVPLTRRRLILIAIVMAVVLGLAVLLRDFVRQAILLPLINLGWLAWVELQRVPQIVFWALFVLVALIIAGRSLQNSSGQTLGRYVNRVVPHVTHFSRYHHWKVNLEAITGSPFARERLERELQNLVLQIMADQARIDFDEMRERQKRGLVDFSNESPAIAALFSVDHQKYFAIQSVSLVAWFMRLLRRESAPENPNFAVLDVPAIIAWLEEQTAQTNRVYSKETLYSE